MTAARNVLGPPSREVVEAFGGTGNPKLLEGGEGRSYHAGRVVLKPADEESEQLAELEQTISGADFRFPRPIRSILRGWEYRGWSAKEFAEGQHEPGRWTDQIDTCIAFHRAISDIPRPGFLDGYDSPWSVADKVAWNELEIDHHPRVSPVVRQLREVLRPIDVRSQLVHGDFGGNLLYADGLPPAVIDFSPYWRPVGFALGVVVADAIAWGGADPGLIDEVTGVEEFLQLLARAELFRVVVTETHHFMYGSDNIDSIDAHRNAVDEICRRIKRAGNP